MSIIEIISYLNTLDHQNHSALRFDDAFEAAEHGAIARYERYALSSRYSPIQNSDGTQLYGHVGVLDVRNELGKQLHPDVVFTLPTSNNEFVRLDRLVRTLHAINYKQQAEAQRLVVKLNVRHIESVSDRHGEVFENALRACHLEPKNITLLINVAREPNEALTKAIDSYRARGYQIALSRQGYAWTDISWLDALKPDVVQLDGELLQSPQRLAELAGRLRAAGWRTLIEVDGSEGQTAAATGANVDLLQYPPAPIDGEHNYTIPDRNFDAKAVASRFASAA